MKDLLETVKTFATKSDIQDTDLKKVNSILERLYFNNLTKWWFPFTLKKDVSFKITEDLINIEALLYEQKVSKNMKVKSAEIKSELEQIFKNASKVEEYHHELIKANILNKYYHHRFAVFIYMLIKGEYIIQKRRWMWGILLGFLFAVLGNFLKDKLFPLIITNEKTEKTK